MLPEQGPPASSTTLGSGEQHFVEMEFGDEYVGEALRVDAQLVPHGRGTLQSPSGKHCYVGDFNMRLRDGYGKLVTDRFVLWSKWKANRPDLTCSARIDYSNGDKYAGYLTLYQDPSALQLLSRTHSQSLSKFSIWVRATSLVRERWGEMVYVDGSRFFGQWERNLPNGFGCRIGPTGDRYIGMFTDGVYDGNGVLFTATRETAAAVMHAIQGMSSVATASGVPRSRSYSKSPSPQQGGGGGGGGAGGGGIGNGAIFDGTWKEGSFVCEEGYGIFPCRTRVTADWSDIAHCTDGEINFATRAASSKPWLETFQWESLLCGGSEHARRKDFIDALPTRNALYTAKTREEVVDIVRKFVTENPSIANSVKIFRRCFYFLYGTCGHSYEIGSGLGNNKLGWCFVRNAFGGCIHRGHGKAICKDDIANALGDIVSFISSVRRWVEELLAKKGADIISNHDLDAQVSRWILDLVMHDVHPPLFNLYVQVYGKQQVALSATIEELAKLTMDDLGVQFGRHDAEEKLFDPYADAIHSVRTITNAATLSAKLQALRAWSTEIDTATRMAQMRLKDEHLQKVQMIARTRTQVSFTTNNDSIAATSDESPTASLSRLDDADSTRMRAASSSTNDGAEGTPQMASTGSSKRIIAEALKVESGSADDLLPIHQYVLIRANVPYLLAHAQMLVDLSSDDTFVDGTSQDAFVITTLHACISILPQLDMHLRDANGVVAPVSVFERRIEDALQGLLSDAPNVVLQRLVVWVAAVIDSVASGDASFATSVGDDSASTSGAAKFTQVELQTSPTRVANGYYYSPPGELLQVDEAAARLLNAINANSTASDEWRELYYAAQVLDSFNVQLLVGSSLSSMTALDSRKIDAPAPNGAAIANCGQPEANAVIAVKIRRALPPGTYSAIANFIISLDT